MLRSPHSVRDSGRFPEQGGENPEGTGETASGAAGKPVPDVVRAEFELTGVPGGLPPGRFSFQELGDADKVFYGAYSR